MNKKVILEKRIEYTKVCSNLKQLRKPCHFVSAVSTICFAVVWAISREFAKPWLATNPILVYSVITAISVPASLYFEKIVSGVIDSFATIFSDRHGWRSVAGISLVLAPILFVAASTSFVGLKNTTTQMAANESIENLSDLTSSLSEGNQHALTLRQKNEIALRSDRNKARKVIQDKYSNTIRLEKAKCKSEFNKHESNNWYAIKLKECQSKVESEFSIQLANELLNFDKETNRQLEKLSSSHLKVELNSANGNTEVLKVLTEETKVSIDRVNWLGGFFGFGAVVALLVSLVAAIMEKEIDNILVSKKANGPSPTLSRGAKSSNNKPKAVYSSPMFSDRGGEDIGVLANSIKSANAKRLDPNNPNIYEDTAKMHNLIDQLNVLGYGAYFSSDELEITFKKLSDV